ncbi:hypothetical protein EYV94_12410 [Puteibacter caeruleilacunae]|nr:hypothetical protein EYV94_12410 [Puteibacter caeruleilacunae]
MKKLSLTLVVLMIGMCSIFAQNGNKSKLFKGRLIEKGTENPVSSAYIENVRIGISVTSDDAGYFRLYLIPGDSVQIHSIGYGYVYHKPPLDFSSDTIYTIEVAKISYNIGEVRVEGDDSINLYLPNQGKESKVPMQLRSNSFDGKPSVAQAALNPINYLYFKTNKKERSKRMAMEAMEEQENWEDLAKWYNFQTFKKITGLTDDDEIDRFMVYCNPHFDTDYSYSEIQVKAKIQDLYKQYKEEQAAKARGEEIPTDDKKKKKKKRK